MTKLEWLELVKKNIDNPERARKFLNEVIYFETELNKLWLKNAKAYPIRNGEKLRNLLKTIYFGNTGPLGYIEDHLKFLEELEIALKRQLIEYDKTMGQWRESEYEGFAIYAFLTGLKNDLENYEEHNRIYEKWKEEVSTKKE